MRVLICGGAGFIGHHLAARCVAEGETVWSLDDLSRGTLDNVRTSTAHFTGIDLSRPDAYQPFYGDRFDEVYLLAGIVGVPNVERDPWGTISRNTRIALGAAEWLRGTSARVFFASTSEVYAGVETPIPTPEDVPVSIRDVTQPRAAYAASKIAGEVALLHADIPVTVGRFHNIFGPRMGWDHVIPDLCVRFARHDDPVRLLGPECQRAFCYIDDAVTAIRLLMRADAAIGQIVNIGDDRAERSVLDIAASLEALTGEHPGYTVGPAPAGSVKRRCPDLTRLRAWTGYEPQAFWEDALDETFRWYAAR